jgi:cell division septation protein DedD
MKGIRSLFRKREGRAVRTGPVVPSTRDNDAPKNGPLVLMVIASVLIMIGLGILNLRLIRDPSVAGKAFNPSGSLQQQLACPVVPSAAKSSGKEKSSHVPPVVTFYRQLTAQDDQPPAQEKAQPGGIAEQNIPAQEKNGASAAQGTEKVAQARKKQEERATPSQSRSTAPAILPAPEEDARMYTVQVGAFNHPAVAQQWAEKWKARGFKVSLKPVARPRTGVIYRLYLGKFSSEKKADELVNRLKSKEGISAFRLLVRN